MAPPAGTGGIAGVPRLCLASSLVAGTPIGLRLTQAPSGALTLTRLALAPTPFLATPAPAQVFDSVPSSKWNSPGCSSEIITVTVNLRDVDDAGAGAVKSFVPTVVDDAFADDDLI